MSDINNKNILIINLRKDCVIRTCKEWPLAYETEAQKEKRKKQFLTMFTFNDLWELLHDHGATDKKKGDCARLWDSLTALQQQQLVTIIRSKLQQDKFVHYDPLRAMRENIRQARKLVLSYAEYYAKYGTTLERDGWKMENPTGQRVIYVKGDRLEVRG